MLYVYIVSTVLYNGNDISETVSEFATVRAAHAYCVKTIIIKMR